MIKLIEIIRQWFSTPILVLLTLHLVFLSGILAIGPLETFPVLKTMGEQLPTLTLAIWAILLYLSLLASYIVLSIKFKDKLTPKFGVLWDRNKEPHCLSCKAYLTRQPRSDIVMNFSCHKCNDFITLITDDGKDITLIEAQKLLIK
jgi:hypothetical protein